MPSTWARRSPPTFTCKLGLCLILCLGVLGASTTHAESLLGFLKNYDLNDYAFGIGTAVRSQPYEGVDAVSTLYPFLTSVQDSTLSRDTFVARNGTYGFRIVQDSGFEIGVLSRLETLGFGSDPEPPLNELDPPEWTAEVGPSIGWRRGWLQPDLALRKGVWGGHDG